MDDPRLPDGPLPTVNQRLMSEAIRYAHEVEAWKAGSTAKVRRMLERDVIPDLREQLERIPAGSAWRNQRVQESIAAMQEIAGRVRRDVAPVINGDLTDFAVHEADWQHRTLRRHLPTQINLRQPPMALLETLATKTPINGQILDQWWWGIENGLKRGIKQQLRAGLALGETNAALAQRLRRITGQCVKSSMAVVRTTATHVSNQARMETFKANKDIVKRWKFLATLDFRTTQRCAYNDGSVHNVGEGPLPPLHFACRSTSMPIVVGWEEMGLDPSKLPESTRASLNGQVPETIKYEQWLRGQPAAMQDKVFGRGRAELWREGKVSLDRMVDASGNPRSLANIRRREGIDRGEGLLNLRQAVRAAADAKGLSARAGAAWKALQASGASAAASRFGVKAGNWIQAAGRITGNVTGWSKLPTGVKRWLSWGGARASAFAPEMASLIARAGGASPASIRRASSYGLLGDWAGFIASPIAPVLAVVNPGSSAVAVFGLYKVTQRSVRVARKIASGQIRLRGTRVARQAEATPARSAPAAPAPERTRPSLPPVRIVESPPPPPPPARPAAPPRPAPQRARTARPASPPPPPARPARPARPATPARPAAAAAATRTQAATRPAPRPPAATATPPPAAAAAAASRSATAARPAQPAAAAAASTPPAQTRRIYSEREIKDAMRSWHLDISERPPSPTRRYFDEFEESIAFTRYGPNGRVRIRNEDYGSRTLSLRSDKDVQMGYLEVYAGMPKSNLSYQLQRRDGREVLSWAMIETSPKFRRQGVAGSLVEALFETMKPGAILDADNYVMNAAAVQSRLSWIRRASQDPRINIMHSAADYDPKKINVLNTPFAAGSDERNISPAWIRQFEELTGRPYTGDRTIGAIMNADSFAD